MIIIRIALLSILLVLSISEGFFSDLSQEELNNVALSADEPAIAARVLPEQPLTVLPLSVVKVEKDSFELALSDDLVANVFVRDRFENGLIGEVDVDGVTGEILIAYNQKGSFAGRLATEDGRVFSIETDSGMSTRVVEVDSDSSHGCGLMQATTTSDPGLILGENDDFDGTIVDVMVAYTADAKEGAGGLDNMLNLIGGAMLSANLGFANSNAQVRLRLVHTLEVDYEEKASYSEMLEDLSEDGDGAMDSVHNYRELYGADIVSLFVENRVTSVSGIAYQLENLSAGNVDRMFSVINRNLSLAGLVFAHEVGHNFGAGHEGEEGFLADSSAHSFATYKTVMSVAQSGTRVNYFSNPAVSFDGVPTGISGVSNNIRAINTAKNTVSGFLATVVVEEQVELQGIVSVNGNLLPNARVSDPVLGVRYTDKNGFFKYQNIPQGTPYNLQVEKEGFSFDPFPGLLTEDRLVNISTTGTMIAVSGLVLVDGVRAPGVKIVAGPNYEVTTSSDGSFALVGYAPGTFYSFQAMADGMRFVRDVYTDQVGLTSLTAVIGTCIEGWERSGGACIPKPSTISGSVEPGIQFTGFVFDLNQNIDGLDITFAPEIVQEYTSDTSGSFSLQIPGDVEEIRCLGFMNTSQVRFQIESLTGPGVVQTVFGTCFLPQPGGTYEMSVQAFGPGCTDWTPELQNCGPVVSNISGSSLDSLIEDNSQITNSLPADGAGTVSGRVQGAEDVVAYLWEEGTTTISSTVTNLNGDFSLPFSIEGRTYFLLLLKPGYQLNGELYRIDNALGAVDIGIASATCTGSCTAPIPSCGGSGSGDDADCDGLPNALERVIGTGISVFDTDGDSVGDGDEISLGTNPLDAGSVFVSLGQVVCSEWNGFLGGMGNIMEHVNLSDVPLVVFSSIFDALGQQKDTVSFTVPPGAQFDLLVHDLNGRDLDAYGRVCSTHAGGPGDLDGRMVYYKPDAASGGFEFAFALPFSNGLSGEQFVPFNTFQPSARFEDQSDLVANWIQITNLESRLVDGNLYFYDFLGNEIGRQYVVLASGARTDISGHQLGTGITGLVRWVPIDQTAKVQIRNIRYLTDNPFGLPFYDSAFQLESLPGKGESQTVPLDNTPGNSAVLEIANTLNSAQTVTVNLYGEDGTLLAFFAPELPAYGSFHLITQLYMPGVRGVAKVESQVLQSTVSVAMQYGVNEEAGIESLYGVSATEGYGRSLKGSYNTFLNQSCFLTLSNTTAEPETAEISLTRPDGTTAATLPTAVVPGNGSATIDICSNDVPNTYGVVNVQTLRRNTLVGSLLRVGEGGQYKFPTPVRP